MTDHVAVERLEGNVASMGDSRECHPAAALFPCLEGKAFEELVADIKANGVREPVWLDRDGRILDGRNREHACRQLGIEPPVRTYDGPPGTEVDLIASLNLHRRNLTDDQRTAIAVELANLKIGDNSTRRRFRQMAGPRCRRPRPRS